MGRGKKPAVAYEAHDGEDGWAVVFARGRAAARRLAAAEIGCEAETVERCDRLPALDRFAPGPAPALALVLEAGWRFACAGCGRAVERDGEAEEGEEPPQRPCGEGQEVFCSEACRAECRERRAEKALAEAAGIRTMVHWLLARVPEARITRAGARACHPARPGGAVLEDVRLEFGFPGSSDGAGELLYECRAAPGWWRSRARAGVPRVLVRRGELHLWNSHAALLEAAAGLHRWEDDGGPPPAEPRW